MSERAAIDNLKDIAAQLIQQERSLREEIVSGDEYQDVIWRSLGILQNARLLTNEEFMKLISNLRLGISAGIVGNINLDTVNSLMIEAQPATLMERAGKELSISERNKYRAAVVRERLGEPQRQS